jgi:hypothetical protein
MSDSNAIQENIILNTDKEQDAKDLVSNVLEGKTNTPKNVPPSAQKYGDIDYTKFEDYDRVKLTTNDLVLIYEANKETFQVMVRDYNSDIDEPDLSGFNQRY